MADHAPRRLYIPDLAVFENLDQRRGIFAVDVPDRGDDEVGPGLADMPPEILHLVVFGFWILDARDVAALRAACAGFRWAFPAGGLDLEKWEARAGPLWCLENDRPKALLRAFSPSSPHSPGYGVFPRVCKKGYADVVALFLERPYLDLTEELVGSSSSSSSSFTGFQWACKEGHAEVVRLLLADGRADPTIYNDSPIRDASCLGHAEVVRLLLADGRADPTICNDLPIRGASRLGHLGVVRALLADGRADPTASNSAALRSSAARGHAEVVRLLLADGRADPSASNSAALRDSAGRGHLGVVRALLADPRVRPLAR